MRARLLPLAAAALAMAGGAAAPALAKGPPADVAVAAGTVWVTGGADRAPLRRLDPATGRVVDSVRAGRFPAHLAAGFGALWATGRDGVRIHRVDPRRGRVLGRVEVGHPILGLAAGAGAVWATGWDRRRGGFVTRVDPARGRVAGRFHVGGGGPPVIGTGHGSLWIALRRLVRIDGRERTIVGRVGLPSRYVSGLAAAGRRMLLAVPDRPGRVVRVDVAAGRVDRTSTAGFNPTGIAADGREAWLLSPCGPPLCDIDRGFLTRMPGRAAPRTLRAVPIRRGATALALSRDAAWVVHAGWPGAGVTRVDRRTGRPAFRWLARAPRAPAHG